MTGMVIRTDKPVDLSSDNIYPLGLGIIYRVVCSPKHFDDDHVSNHMSTVDPPGTSANRWVVSPDESCSNNSSWVKTYGVITNRAPCPECGNRVHILMNC